MEVEILVPTRSDSRGASRVVRESLELSVAHDIRVTVSVSDPTAWGDVREAVTSVDPRVRVLEPSGDLSLYGNFRRLVMGASADWLMICADDDARPRGFVDACLANAARDAVVVFPRVEVRAFNREAQEFGHVVGRIPAHRTRGGRTRRAENAHPSWIFSLWRTSWIKSVFPSSDFDWLDCAVVQRALYSESCSYAPGVEPLVCGIVEGRRPWAVGLDSVHRTEEWETYTRQFVPSNPLAQALWRVGPVRRYRKIARRLNS